jgi:regulator of sirC expression with transglutaminase-like and TPR domain
LRSIHGADFYRMLGAEMNHRLGNRMNEEIQQLGLLEDAQIRLDEAALALAALDHPGVDLAPYHSALSDMATQLAPCRDLAGSPHDQAIFLAAVIAGERGFVGDAENYDDPANADLISVMDRRRGMPIALSILYVAMARRLGWTAAGLNIPGHLLVRVGDLRAHVVVDPFNGGVVVPRRTVVEMLERAGATAPTPDTVPVLSNQEMLVRLLLNQASRAQAAGDLKRALTLYQRMTLVAPSMSRLWWDRAELERQQGLIMAARSSLNRMLETTDDPAQTKRIRAALDALVRSIN